MNSLFVQRLTELSLIRDPSTVGTKTLVINRRRKPLTRHQFHNKQFLEENDYENQKPTLNDQLPGNVDEGLETNTVQLNNTYHADDSLKKIDVHISLNGNIYNKSNVTHHSFSKQSKKLTSDDNKTYLKGQSNKYNHANCTNQRISALNKNVKRVNNKNRANSYNNSNKHIILNRRNLSDHANRDCDRLNMCDQMCENQSSKGVAANQYKMASISSNSCYNSTDNVNSNEFTGSPDCQSLISYGEQDKDNISGVSSVLHTRIVGPFPCESNPIKRCQMNPGTNISQISNSMTSQSIPFSDENKNSAVSYYSDPRIHSVTNEVNEIVNQDLSGTEFSCNIVSNSSIEADINSNLYISHPIPNDKHLYCSRSLTSSPNPEDIEKNLIHCSDSKSNDNDCNIEIEDDNISIYSLYTKTDQNKSEENSSCEVTSSEYNDSRNVTTSCSTSNSESSSLEDSEIPYLKGNL